MAITYTEVDGVPTLVAPSSGQMHAGLVFRVGRADETLARSGVTHLLEHLVLFPLGRTDYHFNGTTGPVVTSFHTAGSEQDVVTFFKQVCAGLAAPPLDRLEVEKSIVRTEWASRTPCINETMSLWRYGARGYGLLSYSELGVSALTPQDIHHWLATWFTRENAVLWIAGPGVPSGLRLPLRSGRRYRVPGPTSALPTTPAYLSEGRKGVAYEAVVPASAATTMYGEVLERTLFRDLRQDAGISYTASVGVEPRGDGYATVTGAVDALPDQLSAAVGGFVDALAKLRAGRIDPADIQATLTQARRTIAHPDAEAAMLSSAAFAMLTGQPVRTVEERMAQLAAVTVGNVQAVAVEAARTGLLQVPAGHRADWAGFTSAPTHSAYAVTGTTVPAVTPGGGDLVVGPDGVTSVCDGSPTTVRFAEVAAMLAWPDGGRQLIGDDGFVVRIEPTINPVDPTAIAAVDAAVTPARTIAMPARQPSAIPQPQPSPAQPARARPASRMRGWQIAVLLTSGIPTVLACGLAGLMTIGAMTDNGSKDDIGWGAPVFTWICTLVVAAPAVVVLLMWLRSRRTSAL